MAEKLFKSITKCSLCSKNFCYIFENGKQKLICNNYRKNGRCQRNVVTEEKLLQIVTEHAKLSGVDVKLTNKFMMSYVKTIFISTQNRYIINYTDGSVSSWNGSQLRI